jgi:2-polyprenyl-3-methyl-5-hydroxy-6-metoxy-1,4-benzoquinol methylase
MPGKLKQLFYNLTGILKPRERTNPGTSLTTVDENARIDARLCGLKSEVMRGWYQEETGELFSGFKVTADDIVLDVGCGDGGAIMFCARQGAHVVFSDVDDQKIKTLMKGVHQTKARKVEGFVSDTLPLPLPDGYATKILSMEMLEHTSNPAKILAELVRVGRPGAQYLITVPDARTELLQKPFANPMYFSKPNHIQIFDQETFVRLVEDSGLKVEKYDSWGFYWTVYLSLFWIVAQHEKRPLQSATLDEIVGPPYHPILQSWSKTWAGLLDLDGSEKLIESFDKYLPKAQLIIARKS